jgi:hypothetical protein
MLVNCPILVVGISYLAINDIDHTKTKAQAPQKMGFASVSIRRFCKSFIR